MSRQRRQLTPKEIANAYREFETSGFPVNELTLHDIDPKNEAQRQAFVSWASGENLVLEGSAGTGKSFIALYLALKAAQDNPKLKVIVVRSAVQTRALGFTPGSLEEKEALYKTPYQDITAKLFHKKNAWAELEKANRVEFMSTSFIRGLTFDNAIVILDETQNLTFAEANSVISRLGKNSRLILCGDIKQVDLDNKKEKTCYNDLMRVVSRVKGFDVVTFRIEDVVRSPFVKAWLQACEELGL